jgi:hypothetical protein
MAAASANLAMIKLLGDRFPSGASVRNEGGMLVSALKSEDSFGVLPLTFVTMRTEERPTSRYCIGSNQMSRGPAEVNNVGVPDSGINLVAHCLSPHPGDRPYMVQVLHHPIWNGMRARRDAGRLLSPLR